MTQPRARDSISVIGYALGVGLVFLPLIGIPARFMLPDLPPLLSFAGAFVIGAIVGAAAAWGRGVSV